MLAREGTLTLPVGSDVERLFHEDFAYDLGAEDIATPTAAEYDPGWFVISDEKRISTRPGSSCGLSRQPSRSHEATSVRCSRPSSPLSQRQSKRTKSVYFDSAEELPMSPDGRRTPNPEFKFQPQPFIETAAEDKWTPVTPSASATHRTQRPRYSLFPMDPNLLSPEAALRSTASDLIRREERWRERLRQRVADREANDERKKRLSTSSMVLEREVS